LDPLSIEGLGARELLTVINCCRLGRSDWGWLFSRSRSRSLGLGWLGLKSFLPSEDSFACSSQGTHCTTSGVGSGTSNPILDHVVSSLAESLAKTLTESSVAIVVDVGLGVIYRVRGVA
jgi:hypothetical protein